MGDFLRKRRGDDESERGNCAELHIGIRQVEGRGGGEGFLEGIGGVSAAAANPTSLQPPDSAGGGRKHTGECGVCRVWAGHGEVPHVPMLR